MPVFSHLITGFRKGELIFLFFVFICLHNKSPEVYRSQTVSCSEWALNIILTALLSLCPVSKVTQSHTAPNNVVMSQVSLSFIYDLKDPINSSFSLHLKGRICHLQA